MESGLVAALTALVIGSNNTGTRRVFEPVPTGRHRSDDYKPEWGDLLRMGEAVDKRRRRGKKRQRDYDRCLANNPCLRWSAHP